MSASILFICLVLFEKKYFFILIYLLFLKETTTCKDEVFFDFLNEEDKQKEGVMSIYSLDGQFPNLGISLMKFVLWPSGHSTPEKVVKCVSFAFLTYALFFSKAAKLTPRFSKWKYRWILVMGKLLAAHLISWRVAGYFHRSARFLQLPDISQVVSSDEADLLTKKLQLAKQGSQNAIDLRWELFDQTKKAALNGWSFITGFVWKTKEYGFLDSSMTDCMQRGTEVVENLPYMIKNSKRGKISLLQKNPLNYALSLVGAYQPVLVHVGDESTYNGAIGKSETAGELFFRSNLALSLENNPALGSQLSFFGGYRVPEKGVIYSPNVQVFREEKQKQYRFMSEKKSLSVLTCAVYDLTKGTLKRWIESFFKRHQMSDTWGMKEKIRQILRAAHSFSHDAVTFGDFGFSYGHSSQSIAKMLKEVLYEKEFFGAFEIISIAIQDKKIFDTFRAVGF
jgi:hypothetical protein